MAVRKTKSGLALKRWFKEDWKDVSTGKACGRRKGDKRETPYCRPSKRVSSKTPKTTKEMTAAEKRSRVSQKRRLGQPAGKPRRVKSLKRRKKS
jgi:predicted alpha-1,6-mannanase (GH76 family)